MTDEENQEQQIGEDGQQPEGGELNTGADNTPLTDPLAIDPDGDKEPGEGQEPNLDEDERLADSENSSVQTVAVGQIAPSIGRVLHYRPDNDTTHAAMIAGINEDGRINLGCLDSNGKPYNVQRVYLYQGEGERPGGGYAEWMPYQVGQATALAHAEQQLAELRGETGDHVSIDID